MCRYSGTPNSIWLFKENVASNLYMKSLFKLWNFEFTFVVIIFLLCSSVAVWVVRLFFLYSLILAKTMSSFLNCDCFNLNCLVYFVENTVSMF